MQTSRAHPGECLVSTVDRDPDIYGIRAVESCRARHEHLFYFSLLDPAAVELPASSGNRQRLSHIAI